MVHRSLTSRHNLAVANEAVGRDQNMSIKLGGLAFYFFGGARAIGDALRRGTATAKRFTPSFFSMVAVATVVWVARADNAFAQEIALTPLQASEVARGYRTEALKLKTVVNEKKETIGRVSDFILGKDGNIYAVLAIGDFTGLSGQLIAVPFRSLKLEDVSGSIVLPGASRSALEKLPVFITGQ